MLRLIHEKLLIVIARERFQFAEFAETDKMIAIHCDAMAVFLCRFENYEFAKETLLEWLKPGSPTVALTVKEFARMAQPKIEPPPPGIRLYN